MRKTIIISLILCFSISAFGSFVGGEKKKDSKETTIRTTNFSNFKTSLNFSLKNFQYKGSTLFQLNRTEKSVIFNGFMKYHKGNVIYIIPFKQSFLVSKFKTPTPNK